MRVSTVLAVCVVALAVSVFEVRGLECVTCNSSGNSNCAQGKEDFNKKYKRQCSTPGYSGGWKCQKTTQTYNDGKTTVVDRRCTNRDLKVGCAVRQDYLGYKDEICICDEDNCNSGSHLGSSMLMVSSVCLALWKLM